MAWHLEFNEQFAIAMLTYEGDSSSEDVQQSSHAVVSMLKEHRARKVLTDLTLAHRIDVTVIDITLLPASYRELGLQSPFTEALVAPAQGSMHDDATFYQTVCVNRGNMVRVFETRHEALLWLAN